MQLHLLYSGSDSSDSHGSAVQNNSGFPGLLCNCTACHVLLLVVRGNAFSATQHWQFIAFGATEHLVLYASCLLMVFCS